MFHLDNLHALRTVAAVARQETVGFVYGELETPREVVSLGRLDPVGSAASLDRWQRHQLNA
jgi:hypothetical protein